MRACWLKWVGRDWSISADYIWLKLSDANIVSFCVPYLGFVNAYCTTMPGLLVVVAVLALLVAVSIVPDRMVPDEPAGNHARAHAGERRP